MDDPDAVVAPPDFDAVIGGLVEEIGGFAPAAGLFGVGVVGFLKPAVAGLAAVELPVPAVPR